MSWRVSITGAVYDLDDPAQPCIGVRNECGVIPDDDPFGDAVSDRETGRREGTVASVES